MIIRENNNVSKLAEVIDNSKDLLDWNDFIARFNDRSDRDTRADKNLSNEFEALLSGRNPSAVMVYNDMIAIDYDKTKPGSSPGFNEGERNFRPFSVESPFLRG
jgi:hypothetical protein